MKNSTQIFLSFYSLLQFFTSHGSQDKAAIWDHAFKRLDIGRYEAASALYEQVFDDTLDPATYIPKDEQEVHALMNYGSCQWGLGKWARAFAFLEMRNRGVSDHDARVAAGVSVAREPLKKPLPFGIKPRDVDGKHIKVIAEHGFGDTDTFIKWTKPLLDAGARITLICQNPLKLSLSEQLGKYPAIQVYAQKDKFSGDYDYDVYTMSLPCYTSAHGVQPTVCDADVPQWTMLEANEGRVRQWLNVLQPKGTRPILICAEASPNPVPGGRVLDRDYSQRSLARLCYSAKKTTLYNLKRGQIAYYRADYDKKKNEGTLPVDAKEGDIIPDDTAIEMMDANFDKEPFCDTSALMVAANLCGGYTASVDTVIPNLAGALGVKTILFLRRYPDVRWGLRKPAGTPSAIFKNVLEFRQEEDGTCDAVVDQACDYIDSH